MRCLSLGAAAVVALALAGTAAAGSDAKAVRIAASAAPWAVAGGQVAITGTVTPHPAGIELTLEERRGGGWSPVGAAAVGANGAFSFRPSAAKVGLATYRVVTAPGTGFAGASVNVPVRVLHWSYVTSIDQFAYITPLSGNLTTTPLTSDGVRYEHPIALDPGCYNQWDGSAWIDYLLQRQYELFSATVGLDDTAPSTQTATYTVIGGDGKKLATGTITAGAAKKIRVSVAGEYRLRLWVNVPDPNSAAGCSSYFPHVVFGDAQLLGP